MSRLLLALALLAPIALAGAVRPMEARTSGPVLILLRDQADLSFAAIPDKAQRTAAVYQALRDHARQRQAPLLKLLQARGIKTRSFFITNAVSADLDPATAAQVAALPEVAHVIPDLLQQMQEPLEPQPAPQSTEAPQWIEPGIAEIKADQVWSSYGVTGTGVVVAGNDTGIQWDHPALKPQYRGWDGSAASHAYNWHDAIHEDISGDSENAACGFNTTAPCDDNGHGTHTLGTVAGDDGNTNRIGVAPGARWVGCRNMEDGWGSIATYLECFEWFLAPTDAGGNNPRPDLAPDIVNNSWGCPPEEGCSPDKLAALEPAVQNLTAAGILVVVSAGNSGRNGCDTILNPPALYPDSLVVGAYDSSTGAIAGFSSRGPVSYDGRTRVGPDMSAPGVNVRSATRSSSYRVSSGTSMAAPHVAGVAALVWSAQPALRGQIGLTRDILQQTARATSAPSTACDANPAARPNNVYGWGKLDALAAVSRALSPTLSVTVTTSIDGMPIPGATIEISGPYRMAVRADSGGRVELPLPAGDYSLVASDGLPGTAQADVTLQQGTTKQLTLSLSRFRQRLPYISKGP